MSAELLEGSEAIARAMVSAGCRFFAGYPMTPFTEVLEGMAKLMPDAGGDCVNAESELEAIGMAWGAAAAGARAATGSVGQGLSLMQESIAGAGMAITEPSCWRRSTWQRQLGWCSSPFISPTNSAIP